MVLIDQITSTIKNRIFESVLSNNLVYNTCWEDPRIDRQLLNIDSNSKVVMLTSAGCNALDYLLDDPDQIHCVDKNPRQNALLNLKIALFRHGNFNILEQFFANGNLNQAHQIYQQNLRPLLNGNSVDFWDKKMDYFTDQNADHTFYFSGTSGKLAWFVKKYLQQKNLVDLVYNLLDSTSLNQQRYYFSELENQFWNGFNQWFINRDITMSMLGVPRSQRKLIDNEYPGGLTEFIVTSLRYVFCNLPVSDNYFWRVYLTGCYTSECRPNYLKNEFFDTLNNRISRIKTYTTTLTDFLKYNPGLYTHYVLLDHQDWLVDFNYNLLVEEWEQILNNAAPGSRILFRSAGKTTNFLPDFVHQNVYFHPELTEPLHQLDRVGTYGSTHLGIVQ